MLDIKERNDLRVLGFSRVTQIRRGGKFGEVDRKLRAKKVDTNETVYGWLEHGKTVNDITWNAFDLT